MIFDEAERVIDSVQSSRRYHDYVRCWLQAAPVSREDFFRRWLFAYASVQTGWSRNVIIYNALKNLDWLGDRQKLYDLLVSTGAGMHNNRTKNIMSFSESFWKSPDSFYGKPEESWTTYRQRLIDAIPGMGMAKTSFVLEMTWPTRSDVICIDTHICSIYGVQASEISQKSTYTKIEDHWVSQCRQRGLAPAIIRALYWDENQGYENSDYWNCVFDDEQTVHRTVRKLKRKFTPHSSVPLFRDRQYGGTERRIAS